MCARRCTSMPSKRTDERYRWLRRLVEPLLALTMIALGLTHGFVYVEGRSMEPALSPGDIVVYRRSAQHPARGEMVLFEHGGGLVVHRVAGVERHGDVRTRGDANSSLDAEAVAIDDIRGTVVVVVPTGRVIEGLAAWLE